MAVETTGSLLIGTNNGLGERYSLTSCLEVVPVYQSPDKILTCNVPSGLAYNVNNGSLYICIVENGSTWFNIGSKT
jgi:hypothetical protein